MIYLKSPEEIEIMAEGGKRLAAVLRKLEASVRVGMTTKEIDRMAYDLITSTGDKPSFLNYRPARRHEGISGDALRFRERRDRAWFAVRYVVKEGDLVKLDLGLIHKGFHLDAARTVGIGKITPEAKRLIAATRKALDAGVKEAKPGNALGDIGFAIEDVVRKAGYSVAQGLTGHGVGRSLHEDPAVFNFGRRGQGEEIEEGMVIAIEPMVNVGGGAHQAVQR